jgi:hypothetical protein
MLLAFIHGPLIAVCVVLAIIAIAKGQVRSGVQLPKKATKRAAGSPPAINQNSKSAAGLNER